MAANKSLGEHSIDNPASILDGNLAKQGLYILNIVTVLIRFNRKAMKNKSKRTAKKIIKKVYEDILKDGG